MRELSEAKVAIVVIPRERFSMTMPCLEHLYAFTAEPFQLLVMDTHSPPFVAHKLREWEAGHPNCQVIRSERFLYPYEAKNLAVKHLPEGAEWVVFVDNDVKVAPQWLSWLLLAAGETGARVLHPFYFIENRNGVSIHMADGRLKTLRIQGQEVLQPIMNYAGQDIHHYRQFKRMESGFVEFHTFMLHREVLKKMGEFEPFTLSEDVNYSLRLREKGERIIFEPRSVTTYVAGPPFEKYDLPYYRFRWDPERAEDSIRRLSRRWSVVEGYWDGKLAWARFHRSRISPLFRLDVKLKSGFREIQARVTKRVRRLMSIEGRKEALHAQS